MNYLIYFNFMIRIFAFARMKIIQKRMAKFF